MNRSIDGLKSTQRLRLRWLRDILDTWCVKCWCVLVCRLLNHRAWFSSLRLYVWNVHKAFSLLIKFVWSRVQRVVMVLCMPLSYNRVNFWRFFRTAVNLNVLEVAFVLFFNFTGFIIVLFLSFLISNLVFLI